MAGASATRYGPTPLRFTIPRAPRLVDCLLAGCVATAARSAHQRRRSFPQSAPPACARSTWNAQASVLPLRARARVEAGPGSPGPRQTFIGVSVQRGGCDVGRRDAAGEHDCGEPVSSASRRTRARRAAERHCEVPRQPPRAESDGPSVPHANREVPRGTRPGNLARASSDGRSSPAGARAGIRCHRGVRSWRA